MPILAPLSRQLALTETQLGVVITVAAAMLTVTSPLWGRALDRVGARTVILAGLALATVGLAGFAAAALFGLAGTTSPPITFTLLLVTRSVLFGAGLAALPVAALAAAGATEESARTRAVGLVGAVQGLSLVLGPAAGGALAVASLVLPLYVAPALTAALLLWMLVSRGTLPVAARQSANGSVRPWDPRVWPVLCVGFLLYLSLSLVQVVIGFLIADRLELDATATAGAVGIVLFACGVCLIAVQGFVVPRLGWPAVRLLRAGIPVAAAGLILLVFAAHLWSVALAFAVFAVGLGLAMPGFAAASTLAVGADQQGAIAGLVTATIGATFIVGPLLGTALYELSSILPMIAALVAAAAGWLLAWVSPTVRGVVREKSPVRG